jgi:hypothetical protein
MAHCQHLDREAKDSYEDAPSTNDSDESVATLPSGHKSDHRYFYHNAEQEANNDPRSSTLFISIDETGCHTALRSRQHCHSSDEIQLAMPS